MTVRATIAQARVRGLERVSLHADLTMLALPHLAVAVLEGRDRIALLMLFKTAA